MGTKTFFYKDLLNDDFAGTKINTKIIGEDYKYFHKNVFYRFFEFILYYLIAKPITFLFIKIGYHQKFINKRCLKKAKNKGYFIYANHTMAVGDAFIPNNLTLKKNKIIVNPDAVSIPGIATLVGMLGAIPLPSSFKAKLNYSDAIKAFIKEKNSITIYPEAHIWPQYTKIRPFGDPSFSYPVDYDAPVFSITNTYVKSYSPFRKFKVKTYINGPFYADKSLSRKEQIRDLRNKVYETMVKNSTKEQQVEINKFIEVTD